VSVIELAIEPQGTDTCRVRVVRSPAGEAAAVVNLRADLLSGRRQQVQQAVLASAVSRRLALPPSERLIREIGRELFGALLGTGEVAGRYRAALALADSGGERLRVVLSIDSPVLAGLPWEAMYDDSAGYLCRSVQLVRHIPVPSVPAPLRIDGTLRILGVVSSPRGLPTLDVAKEREQLERALAPAIWDGLIDLHWAASATWADLQSDLLDGPWHAIHFVGHGDFDADRDHGVLALTGPDGRAHLVGAERLVDLLRQAHPVPRLVVLNSCSGAVSGTGDLFSGTAAALVKGGISAVTAMQYEISDQAAVEFSRGLYTALARGRGVDEALTSGRVAILGLGDYTMEWLTPVLYLRGDQTHLFAVPPGKRTPAQVAAARDAREEGILRAAAATGDELAQLILGFFLEDRRDAAAARQWYDGMLWRALIASERRDPPVKPTRGPELAEAERWFRAGAETGDSWAAFVLGVLLDERGETAEADRWLRPMAEAGYARAMFAVGSMCEDRGDMTTAERWYRSAAEAGDVWSMCALAEVLNGREAGTEAERWARAAAEAGNVWGAITRSTLLLGRHEPAEAERVLRPFAESGYRMAKVLLGQILLCLGRAAEAEGWIRPLAETGERTSMCLLGEALVLRGESTEGERWLRAAAEAGDTDAMKSLADLLEERGDRAEADRWRRAAEAAEAADPPAG
jgi:TPR repeat protein